MEVRVQEAIIEALALVKRVIIIINVI